MAREAVIQMPETFVENLARIWPFRNAGIEKEVLRPAPGQGQRLPTQEGLVCVCPQVMCGPIAARVSLA